jgi:Baseplate J-like protein
MASLDPTLRALDDCGCCAGLGAETPGRVQNRPGLSAIAYRSGTWREFKASLLASLSAQEHAPLARLTTRADDDFTIALLDAFATVADVLTFYQERIANEAYLRTATERRSILELARLIGYELRPGVAAETRLAFTVDDAPGAPGRVTIDVGVKVQSVPGQDEKPQTFETVEQIEARAEWNAMAPRPLRPQALPKNATVLYLAGVATNLKPGDALLLVSPQRASGDEDGAWDFVRLTRVQTDDRSQTTRVEWEGGLANAYSVATPATAPAVYALRTRAALFGHNAPDPKLLPDAALTKLVTAGSIDSASNPHWKFPAITSPRIELDAAYPVIRAGSWIVLSMPFWFSTLVDLFQVTHAQEGGEENFGLSGKTTLLSLDRQGYLVWFGYGLRGTTVFAQSERLALAERPAPPTVAAGAKTILLDAAVGALPAGRRLLITGVEASSGTAFTEEAVLDTATAVTLSHVDPPITVSQLTLVAGVQRTYRRDSVTIFGNVAAATQGETVAEVLGAGDASKPYQGFTLRQPPLTFVRSDSSPTGAVSTLVLRVNDLRWEEVPFFYGRGPAERVYTTRIDDDGSTVVQFGDGIHGTRLPTGQENVRATYRKGVGTAGNVKGGQLTTLLTRPLGLKAAQNPVPAVGGDDPEPRDAARDNAPLQVRTLDRVVSLLDYEDFARAYSGIAKALATWSWDGQHRGVFLTVAGPQGDPVADEVLAKLESAIRKAGDPFVPLRLKSYRPAAFRIRFKIKVDPAYDKPAVLAQVVSHLCYRFSFAARAFGQPVALAEVVATLQAVPGVVAVDVDRLVRTDGVGGSGLDQPLPAAVPQPSSLAGADAAELLTLSTAPIRPGDMP